MELLNISQGVHIISISLLIYIISIVYQEVRYFDKIKPSALHHLHSHGYMAIFSLISINLFYYKGWIMPLVITALYTLLHLMKENYRLVHDGCWTQGIKDI